MRILFFVIIFGFLLSCDGNKGSSDSEIAETPAPAKKDPVRMTFRLSGIKDTVWNGEEIMHYKNGNVQIRGIMKEGKRNGIWKSWYDDGTPWSETTFKDGKKDGKTTTWYENGKKRYEGFFTNDHESGKWIFWNEKGNLIDTKDFGEK